MQTLTRPFALLARPDLRRVLVALCVALPILLIGVYIVRNWQNVPYWDEWDSSVRVALETRSNSLTLETLLLQHGQQRMFFTRLTTAILTVLNGWDVRHELVVSFVLALIALALAVGLYRERPTRGLIAVAFAVLIFSLRQRQNWMIGFYTQYFFPLVFLLGAAFVLLRASVGWRALIGAALLAACASFSFLSGLLVWPVILLAMPFRGYRDPRHYVFWLAAAVVVGLLHFSNYAMLEPMAAGVRPTITDYVYYLLIYLGSPFAPVNMAGVMVASRISVLGLVALAVCAVYLWRAAPERRPDVGIWLSLAAWAVGSGVLTAIARVRYMLLESPIQATSDRYVTHANLLWLAIIALGVMTVSRLSEQDTQTRTHVAVWLRWGVIGLFVVLVVLYPLANVPIVYLNLGSFAPPGGEACVRAFPATGNINCLRGLYPEPIEQITERIDLMALQRIGPFR